MTAEEMVKRGVQAALSSVSDLKMPADLALEASAIALVTRAFVQCDRSPNEAEAVATKHFARAIVAMRRRYGGER